MSYIKFEYYLEISIDLIFFHFNNAIFNVLIKINDSLSHSLLYSNKKNVMTILLSLKM